MVKRSCTLDISIFKLFMQIYLAFQPQISSYKYQRFLNVREERIKWGEWGKDYEKEKLQIHNCKFLCTW